MEKTGAEGSDVPAAPGALPAAPPATAPRRGAPRRSRAQYRNAPTPQP